MDVKEKILFWRTEAQRALAVAGDLFSLRRYLETLFFGHLALEKLLKAKAVGITEHDPIFSHDLVLLAQHANLPLSDEDRDFLARVNVYNIRARYQDYQRSLYRKATRKFTAEELRKIKRYFNRIK